MLTASTVRSPLGWRLSRAACGPGLTHTRSRAPARPGADRYSCRYLKVEYFVDSHGVLEDNFWVRLLPRGASPGCSAEIPVLLWVAMGNSHDCVVEDRKKRVKLVVCWAPRKHIYMRGACPVSISCRHHRRRHCAVQSVLVRFCGDLRSLYTAGS